MRTLIAVCCTLALGASTLACGSSVTDGATDVGGQAGAAGNVGTGGASGRAGSSGTTGQGGASGQAGASGHAGASGQGGASGQAGASGQGGTGAATGDLVCSDYHMGSFSKACEAPADCATVLHTTDCCGNSVYIGINKSEVSRFDAQEKACDAAYPGCGCASRGPVTEDGSLLQFGSAVDVDVDCLDNVCTTFAKACGHVCEGESACFACMSSGVSTAMCSTPCRTSDECKDPDRPSCEPAGSYLMFCVKAGTCDSNQ